MESITLVFSHERDTKNKRRYQEQTENGSEPVIGTLYVDKAVSPADVLTVTISADTPKPAARKRTSR